MLMNVKRFIYALLAVFCLTTAVNAHDWYPLACCSGHDCHPIPCESIIEQGKELIYNGHHFVNTMIKPSQDGLCHVCISNENHSLDYSPVPHCIFIQNNSWLTVSSAAITSNVDSSSRP